MTLKLKIIMTAAAFALVSCASPSPAPAPAPVPNQTMKPIPNPPESKPERPRANNDDQCGAKPLQYLIGKPRTEIPVPVHPSKRRVLCSTCAATMDYREDRQTITFDVNTGIIQSIRCG
ncbi:proteinase inhibitor i78 [Asticcacaulis sp. SL142]|uniref:proteinase inhibitor i78 n=1 Tax=Asticcacaulis sp. SL142 TaxID=2995155 RepID=UPI00226D3C70|nr:proteinase inhibitor i78 [Asticcacaulis sp. SL142]WAC48686.1 proteinase inhibitor i78 [Asticcacaulis sp. SL142]